MELMENVKPSMEAFISSTVAPSACVPTATPVARSAMAFEASAKPLAADTTLPITPRKSTIILLMPPASKSIGSLPSGTILQVRSPCAARATESSRALTLRLSLAALAWMLFSRFTCSLMSMANLTTLYGLPFRSRMGL
ncbi:hypothetical protein D3C85_475840 [compost metagenome]